MINRKPIIEGIIAGAIGLVIVGSGITLMLSNSNKESKDVTTKLEESSEEDANQDNDENVDKDGTQSEEGSKPGEEKQENEKKTEENKQAVQNTSTSASIKDTNQGDGTKQEQTKTEVKQPDAPTKIRFRDDNINFPGGKEGAKQEYDYILAHKDKYSDADEELARLQEIINRKPRWGEDFGFSGDDRQKYEYLKQHRDEYSDADEIIAQLEKEHPEFVKGN